MFRGCGYYKKCFLLDKLGISFEEVPPEAILLPKIQKPGQFLELGLGKEIVSEQLISNISEIYARLIEESEERLKNLGLDSEKKVFDFRGLLRAWNNR